MERESPNDTFVLRDSSGKPILVQKIGTAKDRNMMVRLDPETYQTIMLLRANSGLNKKDIVGQCVAYAVAHMELDPEED